jgi:hypothetical protein
MKITIDIEAKIGDHCMAKNYRRGGIWEPCTVTNVRVTINKDLNYHVSYSVQLDRTSTGRNNKYPDGGAPLFLTVGKNSIQSY